MGSTKKRRQTISKRNREMAVQEKRTLKRQKKQGAAAARAVEARGETLDDPPGSESLSVVFETTGRSSSPPQPSAQP